MSVILTIFFVIAILLCMVSTVMFLGFAVKRNEIGYQPVEEIMKSQYFDHTFVKRNESVYKEYADDFCTNQQP